MKFQAWGPAALAVGFIRRRSQTVNRKVTCSVVGARGYSGLETARLLLQHPVADLTHCYATSQFDLTKHLSSPKAGAVKCLLDSEILKTVAETAKRNVEKGLPPEVVFLATPAEVSMKLAPELVQLGVKVIDLSGAFRLKKNDYQTWYGFEHTADASLKSAKYGLAPFAGPASEAETLVANPGCYATAIALALIPVVKAGLVDEKSIVIDAKSGATGAGKKASEAHLYSEVAGECLPYKVGKHQHYPEIVETVELFAGKTIDAHMTTSLLPTRRGIIAGVYANLVNGMTAADVEKAFAQAYEHYPLVSFGSAVQNSHLLQLKKVVGTGRTHISFVVEGQKLYLFSCLDNLLKGAASQAVENFNRLNDLPLQTGIENLEALS
ncbi:MAG: N-acetyl-gamma-glutamyl-phosphate reductase [Proteobacteria bacterium]|nr:MAG: N-acetyl-gamma-glutamyl-phosphate reductase [Pseudomonadota bacterium]